MTRGVARAVLCIAPFYAYILRCSDGSLYYGSTSDLAERLEWHRAGRSKSTAWRRPVELVWFETFETLGQARRRERSFKGGRTRRKTIDLLIASFPPEKLAPFAAAPCQGSKRYSSRASLDATQPS